MKFDIFISMLLCLNMLTFIITEHTGRSLVRNNLGARNKKDFPDTSPLKNGNKGDFFELTNHPIVCTDPNAALSGFQLYGKFGYDSNSIAYQWKCNKVRITPGAKVTSGLHDKKSFKVYDKDPVKTIHKLNYKCPKDSIIKSMVMERKGNTVNSKTTCIKAKVTECTFTQTKFKNINFGFVGKSSISQLGQFKLNLEPWQALQKVTGDFEKGDFRYRYKWCNISDKLASSYPKKNNGSGGKMKVLYSNPKTLKMGDDYCSAHCKPNFTERSRKCLEYGVIGCSTCDSILKPTDPKYKFGQSICNTYCNKYKKTESCRFYEFKIVVQKKRISTIALKAFGLGKVVHKNIKK